MVTVIGKDDVDRCYSAALYRPGCLASLPWGGEPFDCVVFLCDLARAEAVRGGMSHEIARAAVDWVQVAGRGAKELHDALDHAGVDVGRQRAVGDGSPMTSWHEEASSVEDMAQVAAASYGSHEQVLILVVGREQDLIAAVAAVASCLNPAPFETGSFRSGLSE